MKKQINNFKELDKGKKIVLLAIVPFLIITITITVVFIFNALNKDQRELEDDPLGRLSMTLVEADEEETQLTKNKTDAYSLRDKLSNKLNVEDDTSITLDSPYDKYTNVPTSVPEIKAEPTKKRTTTQSPKPKNIKTFTEKKKSKPIQEKDHSTNEKEIITQNTTIIQQEQILSTRYASSSSSTSTLSNKSSTIQPSSLKNIWAQLSEKAEVKDNSNQVFLLEKGYTIHGRYFPPNSKLYTKAEIQGEYIDVIVQRIKDINTGEEYAVDMYAVNEDRSRGIKHKGKENKETEKTGNKLLSQTIDATITNRLGVASNMGETMGEGAGNIAKRDRIEVSLSKGYRLIFVENL